MTREIVALVPVKGNSERVKLKNLRKFGETSLLELKLSQLSKVRGFADIIVSSEDDAVLTLARTRGFSVHERDPFYSTSDVPMSEVYSYIASDIRGECIAWVNVTNPLAGPECYTGAIEKYNQIYGRYDCLLSVCDVKSYLFKNKQPINFKANPWPRSQDLTGVAEMTFVINILFREDMVKWGSCVGEKPYLYHLSKIDSWDIDDQDDFDFCEMIYKTRSRG